MYEAYYGFREKPFSLLPDPAFLYFSKKHRMAFAMLEYALANQAGFAVISGGIGAGKTTLIRHLLNQLEQDTTVGLISNAHESFGELLEWILLAFDIEHRGKTKVEMYRAFVDFMVAEYARGRRTVLIVDEAQNLSPETLEELRMLSNVNADKDQVLQVILVGQEQLREKLRRPDLVQFAQRIGVDYHLTPLTAEDTREMIRHRLRVAGGSPDLFTDEACAAVHRYTGGTPRLVNLLCDTALVYGFADQCERIEADLIHEVVREKQEGGLFPLAETPPPAEAPAQTSVTAGQAPEAAPASEPEPARPAPAEDTAPVEEPGPVSLEPVAEEDIPPDAVAEAAAILEQEIEPAGEEVTIEIPPSMPRAGALTRTPGETGVTPPAGLAPDPAQLLGRPLRLLIAGKAPILRHHLRTLMEPYNVEVVGDIPLDGRLARAYSAANVDIILIDMNEDLGDDIGDLYDVVTEWDIPVLFNDSELTHASLTGTHPGFGRKLIDKLVSLLPPAGEGSRVPLTGGK